MNKSLIDGYELIDCGNGRRLERFNRIICNRPAPMATTTPALSEKEWQNTDLYYDRNLKKWEGTAPENWQISWRNCIFTLSPSANGQIGIFPEQTENWQWLQEMIGSTAKPIKVLNCFAHTGGSTMACATAGAEVCHIDAARAAVTRARKNARAANLESAPIRWITEDTQKFINRELKRGNKYDGIILDPPAFGRSGKKIWKLSDGIDGLMGSALKLLTDKPLFFLLSCHPAGWHAEDLLKTAKPHLANTNYSHESGNLLAKGKTGTLSLGFYLRIAFR